MSRDRFAQQMSSLGMIEALGATKTTIYPHPDSLSHATRMGMDMSPSDPMLSSQSRVYMPML